MRVNKKLQQVVGASALMMTAFCFASSPSTDKESEGLWDKFTRNVSTTWDSNQYDIYVPVLTWHNRFTYDKEKTDSYNETPWGFGLGKYRYDEDNDWHALYAMAFMDSHNKVEPIAGYAYQKMWIPGELDGFKMGAGFTLSVTARDDYYYIPLPLPLPLVSMEYDRLALQATYIPGTYNNGNVLFAWLRWQW
ncbi:TPA: lipid IV(A) palmitoyltransferase PagP [Providencia stuartii]|uniref:Lipid A acyltransferase PagP n=2 Tax=Providencia stuartii TaxID=588 RepID=A0AAJ1JK76_PROST|nr:MULTISPECIES: lipid IV(A) palmitoyltransferase PagP [Providencia]SST00811.1 Lipid A palmitoyltransferase PagP precursor [Acinetobacter baumannii]AFH92158.1 phospholipid:lipid A palmitoyltransferase [Providencia stuartii MRSN 2154]AMG65639.1 phospholipid:lipid A palmitoyltransferase [Providencia stuartii]APG50202.1 phospholipid:lipid A palmitoyltransferase [Providencia stuartii]AVL39998.1 phospholipid:lipid A palmitoyltransferase [Providencia stuartii]